MKIRFKQSFKDKFEDQIKFIALDKPIAARKFKNKILGKIKEVVQFPNKCKKSIYFDNDNIRDLIVDGYVIVYEIFSHEILIIGIKKFEEKL